MGGPRAPRPSRAENGAREVELLAFSVRFAHAFWIKVHEPKPDDSSSDLYEQHGAKLNFSFLVDPVPPNTMLMTPGRTEVGKFHIVELRASRLNIVHAGEGGV